MQLKGLREAKKQRKELLKTLQHEDLIAYGKEQLEKETNIDAIKLHKFIIEMIETDVLHEGEKIGRLKAVRRAAVTFRYKHKLRFKELRKIWKAEVNKHKAEGLGVGFMYYETGGRYIWLMR